MTKTKPSAKSIHRSVTPRPMRVVLVNGLDGESDPVVMRTNHETGETTVEPWDGEEM